MIEYSLPVRSAGVKSLRIAPLKVRAKTRMKRSHTDPELTSFQVRDAAECLGRLSRCALFGGLTRAGVMFAQIRLQLLRIENGIPLNDLGWLCLANLFTEEWRGIEERDGEDRS